MKFQQTSSSLITLEEDKMKYFWNNRKYETYDDLLNSICDVIYEKVCFYEEGYSVGYCKRRYPRKKIIGYKFELINHYDLLAFFKKFRHNDNDGIYHKAHTRAVYGDEVSFDENGRKIRKIVITHFITIPAFFEQKPWIVIDSYDRIINSKDLRLDALKHNYDPDWREKYRKPRKFTWTPANYRNGHWQKYGGDHAGPTPDLRKDKHHNDDKKEVFEEYGVTFKVRGKRTEVLRQAADWDGRYGWIEKGWKQTRKQKQWM